MINLTLVKRFTDYFNLKKEKFADKFLGLLEHFKRLLLTPNRTISSIPIIGVCVNIIQWILCKLRYPKNKIAYRAGIDFKSKIDTNINIYARTFIINSYIGYNSILFEGCNIIDSSLKKHTIINEDCRIAKSSFEKNSIIYENCRITTSSLGKNSIIHEDCAIKDSNLEKHNCLYQNCSLWRVELGAYSYIAKNAQIGMTKIGKFCSIGARLQCTPGIHPINFISTHPIFFSSLKQCGISFANRDYLEEMKGITIGNDVWIGNCVFIRDGVTVGDGAIIAGGAAVVKDVPPYAVVGGVPAKVLKYRFDNEVIEELLSIRWWDWEEKRLREAQSFFCRSDPVAFINWARNNIKN